MRHPDTRFYVPATAEDELAFAWARVRQRKDGLRITALLFGGSAAAGVTLALSAYFATGAVQLLLPLVGVLIVIPGAVLAIAGASSLLWRSRLRRLAQRKPHDRPRVHTRHHRLLRARGHLYARLRSSLGGRREP